MGAKLQYTEDDPRLQHAFKLYKAGMSDVDVAGVLVLSGQPLSGIARNIKSLKRSF